MLSWIKTFLINRLTQLSSWTGLVIIVLALIAPRSILIDFGIILIVLNDEKLLATLASWAPGLKDRIERL